MRRIPLLALATIALGIGANTAIFSVVRAILLRPLPYRDAAHLTVTLQDTSPKAYFNLAQTTEAAAYSYWVPALTGAGDAEQLLGAHVTANFFSTLGVSPALGRDFMRAENAFGNNHVVIITDAFWSRTFNRDPSALNTRLTLDQVPYNIIGILPPTYVHPNTGQRRKAVELYRPADDIKPVFGGRYLTAIARTHGDIPPGFTRLEHAIAGDARRALWVLLAATGALLLIACANVANLLLARAAARQREFAIRAAIGATPGRLLLQVLKESLILSLTGGALGLALAWCSTAALSRIATAFVPLAAPIQVDTMVLAFTAFGCVACGLLFGALPAVAAARASLIDAIKSPKRTRAILVAAEVALTVVLLAGAGLLLRSLWNIQSKDLGYQPSHIVTGDIRLKRGQDATAYNLVFMTELLDRVKRIPGVNAAGLVEALPLSGRNNDLDFFLEGQPSLRPEDAHPVMLNICDNGYLRLMQMRLIRGRLFEEREPHQTVIINETLARTYFADQDPVGRRIKLTPVWQTIVGVVADARHRSLTEVRPQVFLPYSEHPLPRMQLAVRTAGDPLTAAASIRRQLAEMDPRIPFGDVRTLEQLLEDAIAPRRFSMLLLAGFAVLAMLLAAIGIYGVVSYSVTQRTREIGIRMAVGASPAKVLGLIFRQAGAVILTGIAIGTGLALSAGQLLSSQLYEVTPRDAVTLIIAPLLITISATVAIAAPARRAARVDPIIAIRHD